MMRGFGEKRFIMKITVGMPCSKVLYLRFSYQGKYIMRSSSNTSIQPLEVLCPGQSNLLSSQVIRFVEERALRFNARLDFSDYHRAL